MTSMRKNGKQKQAKTKTFSGCWTCRSRKVKCDSTSPTCQRCQRAGLACAGYDLELYWVTGDEKVAPSAIKRRARNIAWSTWHFNLNSVDDQLADIDELSEQQILDGQRRGGFGVFPRLVVDSSQCPQDSDDLYNEYEALASSSVTDEDDFEALPLVRRSGREFNIQQIPVFGNFGRTCFDDPVIGSLLAHYLNDVSVLLVPLHHPDNPYSSIHFPKALVGAYESDPSWNYTNQSHTSTSVAVFYAVMATSAFHMGSKNQTSSATLSFTAREYRAKALSTIRTTLQSSTDIDRGRGPNVQQCEAILSAMFAMITLDVVEGSMSEFWIHLEGISQLQRRWHVKSPEIERLMNIHLFLTTIARSTSIVDTTQAWSEHQYDPLCTPANTARTAGSDGLIATYGISRSLLSIMERMVVLSEHLAHCTQQSRDPPLNLLLACEEVHSVLLEWFTGPEATSHTPTEGEDSVQLLRARFNLSAFAHALKIYYHTRLFPCSTVEMKVHVRDVAHCLTQIELLKSDGESRAKVGATISWPGFIASCEAVTGKERDVWYEWWAGMVDYGIGNIARLWEVVQESWRLRDEGYVESPAWMPVLRRGGFRILAV